MATLSQLEAAGVLHKLDPELPPGKQELRLFHASDRLKTWITQTAPGLARHWASELSLNDELAGLVEMFCAGEALAVDDQFRCLRPHDESVWELKSTDLRIFGWFYRRDCFVGVVADTADRIKMYNLYAGYAGEAVRFRNDLDLDEPKLIPGIDPHAVVSNYYYP